MFPDTIHSSGMLPQISGAGYLLLICLVISFWRLIPLGILCIGLNFNDFLSSKAHTAGNQILH